MYPSFLLSSTLYPENTSFRTKSSCPGLTILASPPLCRLRPANLQKNLPSSCSVICSTTPIDSTFVAVMLLTPSTPPYRIPPFSINLLTLTGLRVAAPIEPLFVIKVFTPSIALMSGLSQRMPCRSCWQKDSH